MSFPPSEPNGHPGTDASYRGQASIAHQATDAPSTGSHMTATNSHPEFDGFLHRGCTGYLKYQEFLRGISRVKEATAFLAESMATLTNVSEPCSTDPPPGYMEALQAAVKFALWSMVHYSYIHDCKLKRASVHCPLVPFPSGLAKKPYSENGLSSRVYSMIRGSKLIDQPREDCEACSELEGGCDPLQAVGMSLQYNAESILEGACSELNNVVRTAKRKLSPRKLSDISSWMRSGFSHRYQKTFTNLYDESLPEAKKATKEAIEAMNNYIGESAAEKYGEWLDKLKSEEGDAWNWCFEVAEMGRAIISEPPRQSSTMPGSAADSRGAF